MSFQQGLSGLNVSAKALDAIGNNVANANTVGYKSAQAQFADVFAASLAGGGGAAVGIGASVARVSQQFTQGNVTATNNPLDLAINGNGMFRLSSGGVISYTRNGQYQVDKDGYVVNGAGLRLTGYAADDTGAIVPGNFVDLRLDTSNIAPASTTTSEVQLNLDSRAVEPSAMTPGTYTGKEAVAVSNNEVADPLDPIYSTAATKFDITVDGDGPRTITIPAGTYTSGTLATTMTSQINAAFPGAAVDVTLSATNQLVITSRSVGDIGTQGTGSTVSVVNVTGGLNLFGSTNVAGTYTGVNPLPDSLTITAGNNTLTMTVDGTPQSYTLTAGTYVSPTAVRDELNARFLAGPVPRPVASLTASDVLVITSPTAPAGTIASVAGTASGMSLGIAGNTGATGDTAVAGERNFVPTNTLSYTASTAQTVYDSKGNPHNMTLYFAKTSQITPTTVWQMYATLDGGGQQGPFEVVFNSNGTLSNVDGATTNVVNLSFNLANGATSPLAYTMDLSGTSEYGISFGVNQLLQDGYTSGRLSGLSVSDDGVLQGRYSNGKSRNMGQLVLANFNNPNGLQSLGGNQWAESVESGQPIPGTPGQGSLGAIQSAAVEEANVDLTAELVQMITQQRVYQANAQTIKTQDQVLSTLVNLR